MTGNKLQRTQEGNKKLKCSLEIVKSILVTGVKSSPNNLGVLKRCKYFWKSQVSSLFCLCCSRAGLHLLSHAHPSPNVFVTMTAQVEKEAYKNPVGVC